MLIKDKGAPTGQPIDAYLDYARAYNGAGPIADAYAARVLADAHAYQGAGTITVGAACSAAFRDADRARHEGADPRRRRRRPRPRTRPQRCRR